jgi:hypothetical protein
MQRHISFVRQNGQNAKLKVKTDIDAAIGRIDRSEELPWDRDFRHLGGTSPLASLTEPFHHPPCTRFSQAAPPTYPTAKGGFASAGAIEGWR